MSSDDAPHPDEAPVEFDPSPLNGQMHKELERLADALRKAEALNAELLEENARVRLLNINVTRQQSEILTEGGDRGKHLEAIHSRDGWRDDCERHCRNELWLRGLLEVIGHRFGEAAKTSDDGSVQQDILVSKVPELVAEMAYDLNEAKNNYASACRLVADMHEAATGRHGEGPKEGVIEDVKRVRIDRDRFEAAAKQVLKAYDQEVNKSREAIKAKDGAYWERNQLVAALSKLFPSSLERHSGAGWEDDWRWIVMIIIPPGQLSWHIHDSELAHFAHLPRQEKRIAWDGHTTLEKYDRLRQLRGEVGGDLNLIR